LLILLLLPLLLLSVAAALFCAYIFFNTILHIMVLRSVIAL